jgi:hypothetical protein
LSDPLPPCSVAPALPGSGPQGLTVAVEDLG